MAIECDLQGLVLEDDVASWDADAKAAMISELTHTVDHIISGGVSIALEVLFDVTFKVPLVVIVQAIRTSMRAFLARTCTPGVPCI